MTAPAYSEPGSNHWMSSEYLLLGAVSCAAGVLQIIFARADDVLFPSILLSTIIGSASLFISITRPASCSIQSLMASTLYLAYGFGTLNTFLQYIDEAGAFFANSAATPLAINVAHGYVLLTCGVLLIWSHFFPQTVSDELADASIIHYDVLSLAAITVVFCTLMIATGRLGFQGNLSGDESAAGVSISGSIAGSALVPVGAVSIYAAVSATHRVRAVLLILVACLLALMMTQGRRIFLYALIVYLLAYFMAGGKLALRKPKTWLLFAAVLVALYGAFRFFFALRLANWEIGATASPQDLFLHGVDIFTGSRGGDLDQALSENVKTRTFILDYLALILDRVTAYGGLNGAIAARAIGLAVPAVFYPEKYKLLELGSEEALTHPHLGLEEWDAPNSILTAGVGDFGVYGLLIYPLVLCIFLSIFIATAQTLLPRLAGLLLFFSSVNMVLNAEADMSSYFAGARNALLVAGAFLVIIKINGRIRVKHILSKKAEAN